jgi:hypothetical protein
MISGLENLFSIFLLKKYLLKFFAHLHGCLFFDVVIQQLVFLVVVLKNTLPLNYIPSPSLYLIAKKK